ncbi:hypothetical protein Tsubulata_012208 [Turnera subulata]|uniref:Knottin scorpion toxin-like domain-containing protein n=1 Tax=Turnera subulata TaxID=218843 RepID=A0A9Q0FIU4_9ROSI|nr:hypothetical protein Tsubulata_012208 [Turnera subulata]
MVKPSLAFSVVFMLFLVFSSGTSAISKLDICQEIMFHIENCQNQECEIFCVQQYQHISGWCIDRKTCSCSCHLPPSSSN